MLRSVIFRVNILYKFVDIKLEFWFDLWGSLFSLSVIVITMSVLVFSREYIYFEKFYLRFHLILTAFVVRMLLLIFSLNIVRILIGWDGLGLTSYLLVIYYGNRKTYNSGILTFLRNRVGDSCLILVVSIIIGGLYSIKLLGQDKIYFINIVGLFLILIASITKRAQVPFSAWLPAAMAAPTPVSSLVHSSTLVTAGVYLLIRIWGVFMYNSYFKIILVLIGSITIIIAGISAVKETDLKKIIALSTLSQLGLIFRCLGLNQVRICFLHLILHAFIKALLFIVIGLGIHSSIGYQDRRSIRFSNKNYSLKRVFLLVPNLGLCGFPFLSGFYSKDLWIESLIILNSYYYTIMCVYMGLVLTLIYTIRLFYLGLFSKGKSLFRFFFLDKEWNLGVNLLVLIAFSIGSGRALTWVIFDTPLIFFLERKVKVFSIELIILFSVLASVYIYILKAESQTHYLFQIFVLPNFRGVISNFVISYLRYFIFKFSETIGWYEGMLTNSIKLYDTKPNYNFFNRVFMLIIILIFIFL